MALKIAGTSKNKDSKETIYRFKTEEELINEFGISFRYEKELKSKGNYDSFFTEGGTDSKTSEYIIYNQNQCTIKYIIEIL